MARLGSRLPLGTTRGEIVAYARPHAVEESDKFIGRYGKFWTLSAIPVRTVLPKTLDPAGVRWESLLNSRAFRGAPTRKWLSGGGYE